MLRRTSRTSCTGSIAFVPNLKKPSRMLLLEFVLSKQDYKVASSHVVILGQCMIPQWTPSNLSL